eukprot:TRINITY_DN5788_c0_g1_i7.p1 TRINITY_DN5788_c0_g1~~TRINITY_DN5788_c0_g1_i7.p1  ORF type:complete len:290 (-),score=59.21 TRINITY_DN5788_c0_g1_i7:183-1052(-)
MGVQASFSGAPLTHGSEHRPLCGTNTQSSRALSRASSARSTVATTQSLGHTLGSTVASGNSFERAAAATARTAGASTARSSRGCAGSGRVPRNRNTVMRQFYDRGDLPVCVNRASIHPGGGSVVWEVEPSLLDYDTYLPIFFGGLIELEEPYALFAQCGIADMLKPEEDACVAAAVPLLIPEIRNGLAEEDPRVCAATISSLHRLLAVGRATRKALLGFVRKLLPCLRRVLLRQSWCGYEDGGLDAEHRSAPDMAGLVEDTLQLLHRYGGKEVYKLIKTVCPTFSGMTD